MQPSLIGFPSVNFTSATSVSISSDPGTQIGDFLLIFCYTGGGAGSIGIPSGWDSAQPAFGAGTAILEVGFLTASANGSQTFTISGFPTASGCVALATIRGSSGWSSFQPRNALNAVTSIGITPLSMPAYTAAVTVAFSDDLTSETWSLAPSLTQQVFEYESTSGQFAGWFDVNAIAGVGPAYTASKAGAAFDVGIITLYLFQQSLALTAGPTATATVGTPYSSGVTATGGQGGPFTYTLIGSLPSGLSFNSSTGAITGTPTAFGFWTFQVTATDSAGQVSRLSVYHIFVDGPNTPPANPPTIAFVDGAERNVYTTRRIGGPIGAGVWDTPNLVFNGSAGPYTNMSIEDLSAGALTGSDRWGLVANTTTNGLPVFLGNGTAASLISTNGGASGGAIANFFGTSNGAYTQSGNYSNIGTNDADGSPCVLISADGGATWTEADAAHHPTGIDTTFFITQRVDNYLYLFLSPDQVNWAIYPFNMTTGLWEPSFAPLNETINFDYQNTNTNGLYAWPSGNFGILYNNASNLPVYRLWNKNSNTWGAQIATPGGQYGESLMDVGLTFIHGWNYDQASGEVETGQVDYYRITESGTVTPISTIPPCVFTRSGDGLDKPNIVGNLLLIPRDDTNDLFNTVWVADLSTGTFYRESLGNETTLNGAPTCSYPLFSNGYSLAAPSGASYAHARTRGCHAYSIGHGRALAR